MKHLVFSCRIGAAPAWNCAKRSIKLNHRRILSMRKQKGRIPAEVLFGELVHLSHQIRSVGVPRGDTWNDTPPACSGADGTAGFAMRLE
jgi:hypothetical protein